MARINGETVPAAKLKQAGSVLRDIYGQQEHQSLTQKKKHMELLDTYGKMEIEPARERVREAFAAYREKRKELDEADMDDRERARAVSYTHLAVYKRQVVWRAFPRQRSSARDMHV